MRIIYRHYIKFLVGIIIVLILIPAGLYLNFTHSHPARVGKNIQIKIHVGTSSNQIINMLYYDGLIKSKFFAKAYLRFHGYGNDLKSGVYMFNTKMNPIEIFDMLKKHQIDLNYVKLTIPEGYSIKQIGNKLLNTGLIKNIQEFISCVNNDKFNYDFISDISSGRTYRLEGYLYPATYEFEKGMTVHYITDKMLNRFSIFYDNIKTDLSSKKLTLDKAIIIASMIEAEAKADKDRRLISAVIYNRLGANMKLQIDATVEYALGFHKSKIYLKDLKIDSPYNTYKYAGLPKGPISNPGKKSILAALQPDKSNYLYYIAKSDGTHYFTSSYKEFLNIKNLLRKN